MTETSPATAWRCSQCGKWSHAATKPSSHRRFIRREDGLPADAVVLSVIEPTYSHMAGFTDEGGWFVSCGPFDTYEVRLLVQVP